jgi:hypothetical protein
MKCLDLSPMATYRAHISPNSRPGQTPLLYRQQAIDPLKNRALPDYQINVLLLSTRPKNRAPGNALPIEIVDPMIGIPKGPF